MKIQRHNALDVCWRSSFAKLVHRLQEQGNDQTQLADVLQDAVRFAQFFRPGIEAAPLQLYHAGLLFAPIDSLVRQRNVNMLPSWISRTGVVEAEWDPCSHVLEGHTNTTTSVIFSPNGQTVASASDDKTIRIWDTVTGQCQRALKGHTRAVTSVVFSPDGKMVASASYDNTVRVWNPLTGTLEATHEPEGYIQYLRFSSDGRFLSTNAGNVRLEDPVASSYATSPPTMCPALVKGDWLYWDSLPLIWLPQKHRPASFATYGNLLCMGEHSGAVSFLNVDSSKIERFLA